MKSYESHVSMTSSIHRRILVHTSKAVMGVFADEYRAFYGLLRYRRNGVLESSDFLFETFRRLNA